MSEYTSIFATIEERGKGFMAAERNRQRSAYIQSKSSARIVDWTRNDDAAFDNIDKAVANLAADAGFTRLPSPFATPVTPAPDRDARAKEAAEKLEKALAGELGLQNDAPPSRTRPILPNG